MKPRNFTWAAITFVLTVGAGIAHDCGMVGLCAALAFSAVGTLGGALLDSPSA